MYVKINETETRKIKIKNREKTLFVNSLYKKISVLEK